MGVYVTVAELGAYYPAARIIDLAQGDSATETLALPSPTTAAYLEQRIANAEAEANAYLEGRFNLPITPVPQRLKLAVGKLTIYYLYEDRMEQFPSGENPLSDQYDAHIAWLEGVKESEMFVGDSAVQDSSDSILDTADGSGSGMVFGGGGLNEF